MSKLTRRGDTLVEVALAFSAFSLVSMVILSMMNSGTQRLESAIETTMARNEVDSQAEAIRFIHNSYLSEREYIHLAGNNQQKYFDIWDRLKSFAVKPSAVPVQGLTPTGHTCNSFYNGSTDSISASGRKPFIMNTRKINPSRPNDSILSPTEASFTITPTYPRVIYSNGSAENTDTEFYEPTAFTQLQSAEGIWITAYQSEATVTSYASDGVRHTYPQFYDFHIYACWTSPNNDISATIGTIIRLYNPEVIEVPDA